MLILKRKTFAKWQEIENLPDTALCKAVSEMEKGLFDVNLGGCLYKKRISRSGAGKRGGYRTILAAAIGERYIFLHGFPKTKAISQISSKTKKMLCNLLARYF